MSWAENHRESERLAVAAETAARNGNIADAYALYVEAANAESAALAALDPSKSRTAGITAVSAVSLYYKGKAFEMAEAFGLRYMNEGSLARFARSQLRALLQSIWGEAAISAAGLKFSKHDVLISVKGGEVLKRGRPTGSNPS
ncbi:MAG: hypothetical protein ABI217_08410 [Chthoniobacterales bacterium]